MKCPRHHPRALLLGNRAVFLNINLRTLESTPAIAPRPIGSLLNAMFMANGYTRGWILFLIDVAYQAKRDPALELPAIWAGITRFSSPCTGSRSDRCSKSGEPTACARGWTRLPGSAMPASVPQGPAKSSAATSVATESSPNSEGDNQGQQKPFGLIGRQPDLIDPIS